MNPTDPTAGSAPGSALPQKTGETREVVRCYDKAARAWIGPTFPLRDLGAAQQWRDEHNRALAVRRYAANR